MGMGRYLTAFCEMWMGIWHCFLFSYFCNNSNIWWLFVCLFVHVLFDSILMWCFCPCCHHALCLGFVPLLHIFKELSFWMCVNSWGHFHDSCTYHHSLCMNQKSVVWHYTCTWADKCKKEEKKKEIWNQVDSQHSERDHKTRKGWRECWF